MNVKMTGLHPLLHALERNWWLLLLRGLAAILFGLLALIWPALTLTALILLYGAFALTDGLIALITAIRGGGLIPRSWLAFVGVLGIVTGVLTFLWPRLTALLLLYFIAGWAIAVGVAQIVGAIKLRKEIANDWLLITAGGLSVLFGVILFLAPSAGALALTFAIGMYAIVYGIFLSFSLCACGGVSTTTTWVMRRLTELAR